MKRFNKILSLLAIVPVLAISCQNKEQAYTPGEKETDGCYGVYFPSQTLLSELDPEAPLEMTIQVNRTNASGDITVPLVITQDEDIFQFKDLVFENGEEETTLQVTFPNMTELNKEYSCTVAIKDPKYAKLYGTTPTDLTFTVSRVKWNDVEGTDPETGETVTEGYWVDDFMTTWYGVDNIKMPVKVQEHSQIPGFYRMVSPYCGLTYPYNDPGDWDDSKTYYLYVHAEDPDFVWLPKQETGLAWSYGMVSLWSDSGYDIENEGLTIAEAKAAGNGGKLVNGVVTFPKSKLLCTMANLDGWYYGNTNGAFRFILPGGVETDYTWSVKQAGMTSEDGKLPVSFTLGADITSIKYMTFEGSVTGEDLDAALAEFKAAKDLPSITETSVVDLEFEKTGVYTLIAGAEDKDGESHGSTAIVLYYLAQGDEADVEVKALLQNVSLEDVAKGVSQETNLSFMIKGTDLTEVKTGVFKYIDVISDYEGVIENLKGLDSIGENELAKANANGYVGTISNLIPGTDFVLYVWASNGYSETIVHSEVVRTAGDPLPIYQDYDLNSFDEQFMLTDKQQWIKDWNYYAVDMEGEIGMREYLGKLSITASEKADQQNTAKDGSSYTTQYVNVSGLSAGSLAVAKSYGYCTTDDDTIEMTVYPEDGILLMSSYFPNGYTAYNTAPFYFTTYTSALDGWYRASGYMGAIPVGDGYYAFVDVSGDQYNFCGIRAMAGGYYWIALKDLLIVDPEKDDNGVAPASVRNRVQKLRKAEEEYNYIESPEGRIQSLRERMNKSSLSQGNFIANENIHFGIKKANVKVSKKPFTKEFKANLEFAF